ncbi:hypothetical protein NPIL_334621 [Nephila pilipes]|uniref:Uncharacterized protein n=1 Tax=Nephila pilipes TaxID=299642 RepID=A0A8X6TJ93_NEPPI|nr:hypothetical protein NPIL_334621 [Nephila pilipes]
MVDIILLLEQGLQFLHRTPCPCHLNVGFTSVTTFSSTSTFTEVLPFRGNRYTETNDSEKNLNPLLCSAKCCKSTKLHIAINLFIRKLPSSEKIHFDWLLRVCFVNFGSINQRFCFMIWHFVVANLYSKRWWFA